MSTNRYDVIDPTHSPIERQPSKFLYISAAMQGGDWHSTMHTHTCTEIFFIVGGRGQFKIEEITHSVAANDMIIVNPNVEHTEISLENYPLEYIVMGIEGLTFHSTWSGDSRYCAINFEKSSTDILHILRSMLSEIRHKEHSHEIVCQNLLEILLIHLMRRVDFSADSIPVQKRISKECVLVRRYIDNHFKEDLNLDFLAALSHINKYHMVHAFSREYGISPINYLITRRIAESKQLLSDTDHTLSQISLLTGFSSPSYFSQSFRKQEGISPSDYRKKCKVVV